MLQVSETTVSDASVAYKTQLRGLESVLRVSGTTVSDASVAYKTQLAKNVMSKCSVAVGCS